MKLLVNAYSVFRTIALLQSPEMLKKDEDRAAIVLWTIAHLRWPVLMEWLEDCPARADEIGRDKASANWPSEFEPLRTNDDIRSVFQGDGVTSRLDQQMIRRMSGAR
jgi:hypothetical protein